MISNGIAMSLSYSKPVISINGELLFHSYGEQGIVYHVESGNTHLIESVAFKLLSIIYEQPGIGCDYLIDRLENDLPIEKDGIKEYLLSVLVSLQKIDLLKLKD
ncbi:MAG: HPr-rel-A system PqqD family peptide chaperone [Methylomarinum sp.]|nr:HPr-rel-A system PqqD family peptide chaperone [Methylomarinum sp.]